MPHDRQNLTRYFLAAIILFGIVVRMIYLFEISEYPNFHIPYAGMDASLYHNMAKKVAGGDILLGKEVYYCSPFYVYFLGWLYAVFGDSFWTARFANIMLGIGTIVLIYLYTARLFKSVSVALIAAFIASVYGPFVVHDTSMLKTTAGMFLTALSIFLVLYADQQRRVRFWVYTGIAIGLAVNINGQMGLFPVLLSIWLLLRSSADKPEVHTVDSKETLLMRSSKIICLIAGIFLSIAPFAIRNYYVAKDFALTSSISGIHFYIGNHKGAWGGYKVVEGVRPNPAGHYFDSKRVAEKEVGRELKASEVSSFWKRKALEFARDDTMDFIRLLKEKTQLFFSFYEIPNNENYQYLSNKSMLLSSLPGVSLLLSLGMAGMIIAMANFKRHALLIIFFFSYAFSVILTLVTERYRLPVTLALFPMAGFFITESLRYIREKRGVSVLICIFLLVYFSVLGHVSPVKKVRYEKDMKGAEIRMDACKKEGLIWKETSFDISDRGMLWQRLARLRYSQMDTEGAVDLLHRGLKLYPENPMLWKDLSFMLASLGDQQGADEALNRFNRLRDKH